MSEEIITRNPVITLSRVLGMLFIVTCHIIKYYTFIPMHESLGQFFNCGVDLFLFISGYLYGGKVVNRFGKWYFKRYLTVSLPAVIISIIVIVALFIVGEGVSVNSIIAYCLDLEGILFLNWNLTFLFREILSLGPLWFTTIIMICYLLVPALQMFSRKIKVSFRFIILFSVLGAVISISISSVISVFTLLVFAIGYFCGKINLLDKMNNAFFIIYSGLFFAAIIGRLILRKMADGTFIYSSYVSVSHFILGTWFIVAFAFIKSKNPSAIIKIAGSSVVRTLDSYSYYVFLVHGVFCMGVFNLYEKLPLPLATVLFVLATVLFAVILKLISQAISRPLLKRISENST